MGAPVSIQNQVNIPVFLPRMNKRSLIQDLILPNSPGSFDCPKHAVILMDGLEDPSMELLDQWLTSDGTWSITILEVLPWLNIPLSCKKWSEDVVKDIHSVCRNYGVISEVKTLMGHPLRPLIAEHIASLHPTLLVVDRYHDKKNIEYYAEKFSCNIVAMNDDGEYDVIKARPGINTDDSSSIVGDSPAPTPTLIVNCVNYDGWMKRLKPKLPGRLARDKKSWVFKSSVPYVKTQ